MHVLDKQVTVAASSTNPLLPIEEQKLLGDDIELHFAAPAAALQQRAASATIVHVDFSQDTHVSKPLLPSFAQNTPGEVIDEQSEGEAGLQHVSPSVNGLHVAVAHER